MQTIQFIPCDYGGFATGTSRQGYIENVTTDQLIEMFGDPICYAPNEMGGKVTMEWIIETQKTNEDGETEYGVFTLYDWKGSRPWQNDHEWTVNIGGKSIDDYWNALDAFRIFDNTDIRYTEDKACMAHAVLHNLNFDKETA